jgi:hypothetical protein
MTDPVWSVNILLGIGLIGVAIWIYKILRLDFQENVSIQNQDYQKDS